MPSTPRTGVGIVARLVMASALLWLACGEVPQSKDGVLHRERFEPKALQATSGGQWSLTGALTTARAGHTATLLPSGKVLVTGGYEGGFAPLASTEVYDPATGTWRPTGSLTGARYDHTATLLPSGKVLVTGGFESSFPYKNRYAISDAQVYDPGTGEWSLTGSLDRARSGHTTTLLLSGKVLVTGGFDYGYDYNVDLLSEAEVYDPGTGEWSPTGSLAIARYGHTTTLLPSGKVLVTGGEGSSGFLASAEVYDPGTGAWSPTGSLAIARSGHTAILLPSGKVLIAGGGGSNGSLASAEVYDPATGKWSSTGSLSITHYGRTATLLPSGKVLVTGTRGSSGSLSSAEVYDPGTGQWSPTGSLAEAFGSHTATLLPSGEVLVTGDGNTSSAEVYDPGTGAWSLTGTLATARRSEHTATLLPSGKVLVTGGFVLGDPAGVRHVLASAEVYDPSTEKWSPTGSLAIARYGHTATLLPSGKVLVTGGSVFGDPAGVRHVLASAEVYDPGTGAWSPTGALAIARYGHTATLLPSGKVLITGGSDSSDPVGVKHVFASAEVYDPSTGKWSPTGSLAIARSGHTATLLPSGKVLVSGGGRTSDTFGSAEVYDPAKGKWSPTGSLVKALGSYTATLLPSGKVLVIGSGGSYYSFNSVELYDPATGAWSITSALATARSGHTATLLPSGKVLVSGGSNLSGVSASAEVYDPGTGKWSHTGSLAMARSGHTATLLPSGKVLVTGDSGASEVYEDTGIRQEWRPAIAPLAAQRRGDRFHIIGSRLRGLSEASSGNTQSSATDLPLVSLLALEGGALTRVVPLDLSSSTHVTVQTPAVPDGYYILSVVTNGIHGGQMVLVDGPSLAVPTVIAPKDGAFVNNPSPTIRGTADAGSMVTVWLDGAVAGTTTTVDGTWEFIPTTPLEQRKYQLGTSAMNAVGIVSSQSKSLIFTIDSVAPNAPMVTEPEGGVLVNNTQPVIRGTAEPSSTVIVFLGEKEIGRATTDNKGSWSFTPATALPEGLNPISATVTDAAGNVSSNSNFSVFTIDSMAPNVPEVTSPGSSANTSKPVIGGIAEPNSKVTVWLDGGGVGPFLVDAAGVWSFTPAAALEFGFHRISATATDAAGNTSPFSAEYSFTIQKSHYGWGCTTSSAAPSSWTLLALVWSLSRRRFKPSRRQSGRGPTAQ